jgi:hypothetical protein
MTKLFPCVLAASLLVGCSSFSIKDNTQSRTLNDFDEVADLTKRNAELVNKVKRLEQQVKNTKQGSGWPGGAKKTKNGHTHKIHEFHSHTFNVKRGTPLPFIGDHYPMEFNEDIHAEVLGPSPNIEQVGRKICSLLTCSPFMPVAGRLFTV